MILLIFILLIAYKYISSGINEQKASRAREPLDQCLESIEVKLGGNITMIRDAYLETYTPEWKSQCESLQKADCRPVSLDNLNEVIKEYRDEADAEKQVCYKRYK